MRRRGLAGSGYGERVRPDRLARRTLTILGVVSAVGIATLLLHVPTVHTLRGWFWPLQTKPPQPAWLVATSCLVGALAVAVHRLRRHAWPAGACLCAAAVASQFGVALTEGRGLDSLRERAVFTGHSEFGRVAASGTPAWTLLTDYEKLASDHPYCSVKAPGQLLVYVAMDRLAQRLVPADIPDRYPVAGDPTHRFSRLVELMAWLMPFLAALAVLPIGSLGRRFLPADTWYAPALLYALSAPFALITLHLDQVLYPTAAATLWCVGARAGESDRSWALGGLAGLLAWAMAFLSFGLMPAIALTPVFTFAVAPPGRRVGRSLGLCVGMVAAAATVWLVTAGVYDPLTRYRGALAAHAHWKGWSWEPAHVAAATRMNLVEYGWWANPGLTVVWLAAVGRAAHAAWHRRAGAMHIVNLCVAAGILALAVGSSTFAETPRLWMFLLPPILLGAVQALRILPLRHLGVLLVLQWAWTVTMKVTQDFR